MGLAARFDTPTTIRDVSGKSFREVIRPGAFARSITEKQDVRFLRDHNPSILLGRTRSGTLRLSETPEGLAFEVDLPETQEAESVRQAILRGDLDGCSFGFLPKNDRWSKGEGDVLTRELLDVDLFDCSVVTFPAYEDGTRIDLRSVNVDAKGFDYKKRLKLRLRIASIDMI